MGERTIYVTEFDLKRLNSLLNGARSWNEKDRDYLTRLEEELEWAQIVSPQGIPGDVVTMNSRARVRDLNSNEEMVFTLVFPDEADYIRGKLSVLAPIGTALLGYRAGDTVEWEVIWSKRLLASGITGGSYLSLKSYVAPKTNNH